MISDNIKNFNNEKTSIIINQYKMIDIHTHLFNLKYLPVQGILKRFTNNIVPDPIAGAVANVLIRHTKSDFEIALVKAPAITLHEKIYGVEHNLSEASILKLNSTEVIDSIVANFSVNEINDSELQEALVEFYSITNNRDKEAEFSMMFKKYERSFIGKFKYP